jgi:hypothetical protein
MRPIPNFFLIWDRTLYDKNATGYFATSLLLHFICAFVIYFLVKQAEKYFFNTTSDSLRPFITALLFLFYPYHAEPVMWIIGRVAIIAALFSFASLYCYLKIPQKRLYLIPAWLFFAIALFTYESIWNVIFIFFTISVLRMYKYNESKQKELFAIVLMGLTFLGYLLFRKYSLGTVAGNGYAEINQNISNVKLLIVNTVKLTGRNFTPPFINTSFAIAFFATSVIFYTVCVYKIYKRNRRLAYYAILLWVFMATAVVTAAPLGIDTHYNESERYIYYSSFFFCLFISLILPIGRLLLKKQILATTAVCLIFILLLIQLQQRYRESSAITKSTVTVFKENSTYHRAIVIDAPNTHYGVPVLRINPMPIIKWMVPNASYDTVIVLSQTNNIPINYPYKIQETNWQQLGSMLKTNSQKPYFQDSLGAKISLMPDDLVLWYRTDGLYRVNMPNQLPQKKE